MTIYTKVLGLMWEFTFLCSSEPPVRFPVAVSSPRCTKPSDEVKRLNLEKFTRCLGSFCPGSRLSRSGAFTGATTYSSLLWCRCTWRSTTRVCLPRRFRRRMCAVHVPGRPNGLRGDNINEKREYYNTDVRYSSNPSGKFNQSVLALSHTYGMRGQNDSQARGGTWIE